MLLGLGGWTDSAGDKYSRLVASPVARDKFANKLIAFLSRYNFKGLHLDWHYPVCWQSNCKKGAQSDRANFAKLVQVRNNLYFHIVFGIFVDINLSIVFCCRNYLKNYMQPTWN